MEEGRQIVDSSFPAVISVVKDYGEPRYPSFMGIRKASKAEIPVWGIAELGIDAPEALVAWPDIHMPPAKEVKLDVIEGASPSEIADKLADKIIEEGVL